MQPAGRETLADLRLWSFGIAYCMESIDGKSPPVCQLAWCPFTVTKKVSYLKAADQRNTDLVPDTRTS